MHRVEWKKQARDDVLNIVEYIAADNAANAEKLADEIEAKVGALSRHPEMHRVGRIVGTREMVVHPNYIVIYRVLEKTVEILRVKHAAQQWPLRQV